MGQMRLKISPKNTILPEITLIGQILNLFDTKHGTKTGITTTGTTTTGSTTTGTTTTGAHTTGTTTAGTTTATTTYVDFSGSHLSNLERIAIWGA